MRIDGEWRLLSENGMEVILLGCMLVHAIPWVVDSVDRLRSRGGVGEVGRGGASAGKKREADLRRERDTIMREMERYNTPSTFVQYAKMQRRAQSLDREMEEIKEAKSRSSSRSSKLVGRVLTPLRAIMAIAVLFLYPRYLPVMDFDCSLVRPLGGFKFIFTSPVAGSCGLSPIAWWSLCNGVFSLLLTLATSRP